MKGRFLEINENRLYKAKILAKARIVEGHSLKCALSFLTENSYKSPANDELFDKANLNVYARRLATPKGVAAASGHVTHGFGRRERLDMAAILVPRGLPAVE